MQKQVGQLKDTWRGAHPPLLPRTQPELRVYLDTMARLCVNLRRYQERADTLERAMRPDQPVVIVWTQGMIRAYMDLTQSLMASR